MGTNDRNQVTSASAKARVVGRFRLTAAAAMTPEERAVGAAFLAAEGAGPPKTLAQKRMQSSRG
jgi:hypothetical protein